eukprot:CAMPEP_0181229068 /NCGR_PEP_ID=MMETSP1096-20121128/33692_1 /TAXON_ID=156174 ORGANISM="Chrysochromulina ericina, Strain CCMP281" /NCGR_SAMPLE_ID=MMETSP1096 /ASSEMBLY_ACC=CAM_ASM_000453 /LENGTH=56 /DNA_ID=CAMNT_0023322651 /DNA_START=549 /DNA_END=716 /DNA_ORIENTATION=+
MTRYGDGDAHENDGHGESEGDGDAHQENECASGHVEHKMARGGEEGSDHLRTETHP